jgi:hypothetical protein
MRVLAAYSTIDGGWIKIKPKGRNGSTHATLPT